MQSMTKFGAVAALAACALFSATAANAATIADPSGVLLDTVTATIPVNPETLDLNDSPSWASFVGNANDGLLAGQGDCMLSTQGPERVYVALNLTVVKSGTYTFRIVGTDPEFAGDSSGSPIQDPFMALYENFDPTALDTGVIGCNDDEYMILGANSWANGDTFPTNGESNTNDRWSHFTADLDPGNYTVVMTTWGPVTESDWAAFAPQSATFEYWGPDCGIEGTTCLAETGVDATPSLNAGIGLLAAGVAAVAVRRRRAVK